MHVRWNCLLLQTCVCGKHAERARAVPDCSMTVVRGDLLPSLWLSWIDNPVNSSRPERLIIFGCSWSSCELSLQRVFQQILVAYSLYGKVHTCTFTSDKSSAFLRRRVSALHRARLEVQRSGKLAILRSREETSMIIMTISSWSREPSSRALRPYQSLAKGISSIGVKSQASSSLNKFVLHSVLYSKCSLDSSSSSSCSRILKNRIEKLPQTVSSNGGTQFFGFGLPELRKSHNVCLSSKQRGVVTALLPGAGSVELAANLFTLATAIVVPFYTVMILAPKWEWTNKMMRSEIPYFILGAGYIYLLALSWTPETLGSMFSSKYWLPELAGITRMFSSTVTVASAWLHLLAVDLFAGRQVFLDGAKHDIETRHSLVLCLMMCPIGIFSHLITKNLTLSIRRRDQNMKKVKQIPPF